MAQWNARTAWIYFARNERDGLIKVGITTRLRQRLFGLKSETRAPITMLAHSRGWLQDRRLLEKRIHALLSSTNYDREWFFPSELVDRCIAACSTSPTYKLDGGLEADVLFSLSLPCHAQAPVGFIMPDGWCVPESSS